MAIDASEDRRWVTVTVPTWIYGGDPRGFFADSGLTAKPGPDRATWRIKTHEAYHLSRPDLVRTNVLVAAHQQNGDWSRLPLDSPGWTPPTRAQFHHVPPQPDQLDLLDLLDLLNHGRLNVHTAPRQQLQDACLGLLDGIRAVTLEKDGGPGFPEADLHVLGGTRSLLHRLKLPQVLLRLAIEPDLQPHAAQRRAGTDELIFKSSEGLLTGAYLLDAYLGPLLGALSPAIWGVAAPRGGQLIFNLGRQVGGTTALPSDLLGTIIKQGADAPVKFADLPPGSVPAALRWWADQLNQVFGVLGPVNVCRGHRCLCPRATHGGASDLRAGVPKGHFYPDEPPGPARGQDPYVLDHGHVRESAWPEHLEPVPPRTRGKNAVATTWNHPNRSAARAPARGRPRSHRPYRSWGRLLPD